MRVKISGEVLSTQSAGVRGLPGLHLAARSETQHGQAVVTEREVVADGCSTPSGRKRLSSSWNDVARVSAAPRARRSVPGFQPREIEHLAARERDDRPLDEPSPRRARRRPASCRPSGAELGHLERRADARLDVAPVQRPSRPSAAPRTCRPGTPAGCRRRGAARGGRAPA